MENIEINNNGNLLVGNLHRAGSKIVIQAHGFTSNKDREKNKLLAERFVGSGISFLRFDFGGSGESYETEISIKKQETDLLAVIDYVKKQGFTDIGVLGESLGGLVALKTWNEDIKAMVLWAPVTKGRDKLRDFMEREGLNYPELSKKGHILMEKDSKKFKIPLEYFEERKNFDEGEVLGRVKCPVLILHGDADYTIPVSDSKDAVEMLENAKLEIIPMASHKIDNNEKAFQLTVDFFKENL